MINHYVVYRQQENETEQPMLYAGEFEELETAVDMAELLRSRYPDCRFEVRGVSYNRTDYTEGKVLSTWEPIPEIMRERVQMRTEEYSQDLQYYSEEAQRAVREEARKTVEEEAEKPKRRLFGRRNS